MVKQVFVFSDMQLDQGTNKQAWSSSRIEDAYVGAGYGTPELMFWTLAGQPSNPATMGPKRSTVSGYLQGMLEAFLETGVFDGGDEIVKDSTVIMPSMTQNQDA